MGGIPADLAAGPCVELWADKGGHFPQWSARINWRAARNKWARTQGLHMPGDYRHLPKELRDRAPYYRDTNPDKGTPS
jgi:hypothetical protein